MSVVVIVVLVVIVARCLEVVVDFVAPAFLGSSLLALGSSWLCGGWVPERSY